MISKIGVWNTAFLGDAILTLPLIESLKNAYPNAQIDYYVRNGFSSLFSAQPYIDNSYDYKKNNNLLNLFKFKNFLQNKNYDLWISAHKSIRSGLIAKSTKAKIKISYKESTLSSLFYDKVVDRNFGKEHEVERLLNLLKPLNIYPTINWPNIFIDEDSKKWATSFFSTYNLPVIGIHPGSTWETKRWPLEYFLEVGIKSINAGAAVIIFGGKDEINISKELETKLIKATSKKELIKSVAGELSLLKLTAAIKHLACYVTNDSGPMHLAWAMNIPVCAIFGPTVEEFGFFPKGINSKVFEVPLNCRPCGLHGHKKCPKKHHNCMNLVTPDQVFENVKLYIK